ncbi:MAG: hypothetical protein K8R86_00985, partial [Bacteroidales bacterium]|nr:hypothetical protein [Bacteroidales bacterium]
NKKMIIKRLNMETDSSKAILYILLYVVVMLLLLKLITDLNTLSENLIDIDTSTKYCLIDERKTMP